MTSRFWFYLAVAIVLVGGVSLLLANNNRLQREIVQIEQTALAERRQALMPWLERQTDARKLVSLAKRLRHESPVILELIVMRAYELNPNSRDIAILASEFDPKAKERVKFLDPLYDFDGD